MEKVIIVKNSNRTDAKNFFTGLIYDQGYTHNDRLGKKDQVENLMGAFDKLQPIDLMLATTYREDNRMSLHLYKDIEVEAFSKSSAVEWFNRSRNSSEHPLAVTLEDYMAKHPRDHSI